MIIITDIKNKNILKKFSHLQWLCIGTKKGINVAETILKKTNRKFIAKDIECITDLIRDNFVDYIGMVSMQQNNMVLWYSSCLASKSTFQYAMFNQYVYLKLLEKFLENQKKDILVVSDNDRLIDNAGKIFAGRVKVFKKKKNFLKQLYLRQAAYNRIVRYFFLWIFCKFFKSKRVNSYDVFIHSWIDDRVFNNLPEYNDSYFGNLECLLKEEGRNIGRLTPLWLYIKDILKLNKYYSNMVYPLAYLSLKDFLKAAFSKFKIVINSQKLTLLKDQEILRVLLKDEVLKENNSRFFVDYLLFFYSYKRLSLVIKKDVILIYPFENQTWEKMLNLAFSKINRAAYQHVPIPYNQLSYRVSRYEKNAPMPTAILTIGSKWSVFLSQYYKNLRIEETGAFRFSHLFDERRKAGQADQRRDIIVILPICPAAAISLQIQLADFLCQNSLAGYNIKIKPHPYLPKYACMEALFSNYKNCKFTKENVNDLLKQSVLLITSGSGVVFESLSLGIKTLYFIPEELSLGVEYFIRDKIFIAYEENFTEKLEEALRSSMYPQLNTAEYFSKPKYNFFREFK